MKKKKVIKILILIILISIAGLSIFFGIYFTKLTTPKHIFEVGIDRLNNKITNYTKIDDKYNLNETFSITSTLDFDLDSEDYLNKSKTNKEYLDKYKTIKNLSATTNNITINQKGKKKTALIEIESLLDKEKLLHYKYLIDNSTSYYYVEDVLNKYVNDGTNNYFEMFNDGSNTVENMTYLHSAVINALKSSIKEEYFEKYNVVENIDGSKEEVNQISLRIDDKRIHEILNSIISNLKDDARASEILTSIDENFSKYKIKNSTQILEKQESYTINIYVSKYRNVALKYEIVHLKGDEKKIYSYLGDSSQGTLYYIEDDTVIYAIKLKDDQKIIDGKISDSASKEVGTIKLEKNDFGTYFTLNFDDKETKYDIIYSSKNTNVKDNKSFNNEKKLSFKYLTKKVSILSGEVTLNSEVSNKSTIEEDVTESVLSSTLSDETKNKFTNRTEKLRERLKK